MVIDAAGSGTGDSTDVAVAVVPAVLMLAVLAVPALLVLRALRKRSVQRFELMRQWAAVDRGHDAEFPLRYGTQGYPHGRFIYGAVVLVLTLILAVALLANFSDPDALGLLPLLVVAGLFAWAPVKKYAGRYSWSARERAIRTRARTRELNRT
ncbi:hypothetical protein AB0I82_33015 [Streptomyces sp. NPDC050315]|uniref:hypothetical protein n=1 Tax=Streptomyces sp. NPDC050315 TaxID=3155039 RepID=UPI003446B61A